MCDEKDPPDNIISTTQKRCFGIRAFEVDSAVSSGTKHPPPTILPIAAQTSPMLSFIPSTFTFQSSEPSLRLTNDEWDEFIYTRNQAANFSHVDAELSRFTHEEGDGHIGVMRDLLSVLTTPVGGPPPDFTSSRKITSVALEKMTGYPCTPNTLKHPPPRRGVSCF